MKRQRSVPAWVRPTALVDPGWIATWLPDRLVQQTLARADEGARHARRRLHRLIRARGDLPLANDEPIIDWLERPRDELLAIALRLGAFACAARIRATVARDEVLQIRAALGDDLHRRLLGLAPLQGRAGPDPACWQAAFDKRTIPALLRSVGAALLEAALADAGPDAGPIARTRLRLAFAPSEWRARSAAVELAPDARSAALEFACEAT